MLISTHDCYFSCINYLLSCVTIIIWEFLVFDTKFFTLSTSVVASVLLKLNVYV